MVEGVEVGIQVVQPIKVRRLRIQVPVLRGGDLVTARVSDFNWHVQSVSFYSPGQAASAHACFRHPQSRSQRTERPKE